MTQPKAFTAVVAMDGDRVYLPVPFDPDEAWGHKRQHRVGGEADGKGLRGIVEQFSGGFGVALGPAWQRDCGISPGDQVRVRLAPEGPQRDDLDPDVAAALEASPEAGAFFDSMAQFYRKGYLRWIDGTKRSPDERARRIAEMVRLLEEGHKERPRR